MCYGKTTLMAQWAQRTESRVAWLSCDDADNDPVVLLSALTVALGRIGPEPVTAMFYNFNPITVAAALVSPPRKRPGPAVSIMTTVQPELASDRPRLVGRRITEVNLAAHDHVDKLVAR